MNDNGILLLHKELFNVDMILLAAKQYHELALITVHEKRWHWECVFSNCKYDIEMTTKEFENYVINMINVRHQ